VVIERMGWPRTAWPGDARLAEGRHPVLEVCLHRENFRQETRDSVLLTDKSAEVSSFEEVDALEEALGEEPG
jgi:hypothetical protein